MASQKKRYYVQKTVVPFEEDNKHEFKGHLCLCEEELKQWQDESTARTRKPSSSVINSFLNTGDGGTLFLGIADNGTVEGIRLTIYQRNHYLALLADLLSRYKPEVPHHVRDHFRASLEDLLSRYKPEVPNHMVSAAFVPVVEENLPDDEIRKILAFREPCVAEKRAKEHRLRTQKLCWCQVDAQYIACNGTIVQAYVIEVSVQPWDPSDQRNNTLAVGEMRCHPIFQNECGNTYFRSLATSIHYEPQEIYRYSLKLANDHYEAKIQRLKEERDRLRRLQLK